MLKVPARLFACALLANALPACSPGDPGSLLYQASGPAFPQQIAVSASGLFYVDEVFGSPAPSTSSLDRIPLAGGAATSLLPASAVPTGLAVSGTGVYVFDANGIEEVPQAGGAVTTLVGSSFVSGTASALTPLSSGDLLWIDSFQIWLQTAAAGSAAAPTPLPQATPCALAADSASVYWLDCTAGTLSSMPLASILTATPTVLAMGLSLGGTNGDPSLFAAGGAVYWTEPGSGAIGKVTTGSGAAVTLVPAGSATPSGLVADGTEVYWLSAAAGDSPGSVWEVAAAGGTATQLLSGSDNSEGGYGELGLDASYLYFWDNGDATLRRIAR